MKGSNVIKFKDLSKKKKITTDEIACLLNEHPAIIKFDIMSAEEDGTLKPCGLKDFRYVYDVEDVIHWATTYRNYSINVGYLNTIPTVREEENKLNERANRIIIKMRDNKVSSINLSFVNSINLFVNGKRVNNKTK